MGFDQGAVRLVVVLAVVQAVVLAVYQAAVLTG